MAGKDAWSATSAVDLSRISPITITSGSCRRSERRSGGEVRTGRRIDLRLGHSGTTTSIGSSSVTRLRARRARPGRQLSEACVDGGRLATPRGTG